MSVFLHSDVLYQGVLFTQEAVGLQQSEPRSSISQFGKAIFIIFFPFVRASQRKLSYS